MLDAQLFLLPHMYLSENTHGVTMVTTLITKMFILLLFFF